MSRHLQSASGIGRRCWAIAGPLPFGFSISEAAQALWAAVGNGLLQRQPAFPPQGGRTSGEQKAAACTVLPLCFMCELSSAHQAGLDREKPDAGAIEPDAQGAAVSSNTWLRVTKGKEAEGETYYHEIHYIRSALKELRGDFVFKPLNPRVI